MPNQPLLEKSSNKQQSTQAMHRSVRPLSMSDYIGQTRIKNQIEISIQASMDRKENLDHILLYGPPGLGKTSLANVIAHTMNVQIHTTSGPVLERAGDLAAILSRFNQHDILFIDEIHRLQASVEEMLYSAMEDFKIDLMLGEGPAARNVRIDITPFTLIGATTRAGMLTSPLLDRFGIQQRLLFYNVDELAKIILRSADIFQSEITAKGAAEIANRSRGTPRIANRLLRRVRDYAHVRQSKIDETLVKHALSELDIDENGLNLLDRQYLQSILEKFQGGPVGVDTLATVLRESKETLEDVIEPFLIQDGFLMRTSRGRVLTHKAYTHFGIVPPEDLEQE